MKSAEETQAIIKKELSQVQTMVITCDVTNETDVDKAFEALLKNWGGLDILVNATGVAPAYPLVDLPVEKWRFALEVNLTGYFLMAKAAVKIMIKRGTGGSIINISSKSGLEASMLFSFLPWFLIIGCCSGFGSGHCYRHINRNFTRAANNPRQSFSCNLNRPNDKFRDTVGLETGVIEGRVFLRHQHGLIYLAFLVNIAKVRPGEYPILSFTAESYPSAVTGPAVPGFTLVAVDLKPTIFEPAVLLCAFEVHQIQIAVLMMNGEGAVTAHAEQQPAAVGTNPRLKDAQTRILS